MKCPRCNINLNTTSTYGVEIEYCPECRGVWLDRGELEKIIEQSEMQRPADFDYSNRHSDHGHHDDHDRHDQQHGHQYGHNSEKRYHSRHNKGFLSELFDF
jgi:uncharacterized protein